MDYCKCLNVRGLTEGIHLRREYMGWKVPFLKRIPVLLSMRPSGGRISLPANTSRIICHKTKEASH